VLIFGIFCLADIRNAIWSFFLLITLPEGVDIFPSGPRVVPVATQQLSRDKTNKNILRQNKANEQTE
jgi:hypothetical protein